MVYVFMCSCLFSRSVCVFSLTMTNVGGTGEILKTGEIAVKSFQLVCKFNERLKMQLK